MPSPSGIIVCTEPLPNERVPTSVARFWSWSAPATILGVKALHITNVADAGGNNFPPIQKRIRNRNRLIKQAAGIVAQIDYEALDLVGAQLAGEVAERFLQPLVVWAAREAGS